MAARPPQTVRAAYIAAPPRSHAHAFAWAEDKTVQVPGSYRVAAIARISGRLTG